MMNVTQLMGLLEDALVRGLDPETEVVVASDGDWCTLTMDVGDPSSTDPDDGYIWFTLFPGDCADDRFTHGHYRCDNDEETVDARLARAKEDADVI